MDEAHDLTAHLRALRQAMQTLSGALAEQEAVQALLAQAVSAINARGALVRLVSPDGDLLLPVGAQGLSETYLQKGPVEIAKSQVDQRVLAGEVVVIPDVTREPGFQYPQAAAQEGLRGMVALAMSVRGRPIGVLRVYVDDVDDLRPEDLLMLGALADLGALALEKVRLHQSLYNIARALNASLELEPMLHQVLEATVREMGLKAASVRLLDPRSQTLRLVATYGLSETYLAKGEVRVEASPVDQRVLRGEVVVLYDVEHEVGFQYPEEAAREGIRSVLAVPLRLKERTLGVMRVYSAQPRRFGRVATAFLTAVADLVALAIESAELYAALQARYEDLKLDLAEWYRFLALG
ncbi:MAG TPA: GAF domain-containing protein [Chloroflexi bacterium]|nr:GAF domain-containing protein [Chloroflexota bacterium]